jgi:hypothetical protein
LKNEKKYKYRLKEESSDSDNDEKKLFGIEKTKINR